MRALRILDILPALDTTEGSTGPGLRGEPSADGDVGEWPAHRLLAEGLVHEQIVAPVALSLGRRLVSDPELRTEPLGTLLPELPRIVRRMDDRLGLDPRVVVKTADLGVRRWSQLSRFSPRELQERHGAGNSVLIVTATIRLAAEHALGLCTPTRESQEIVMADALSEIALWALHELKLTTVHEALEAVRSEAELPPGVSQAATSLLDRSLSSVATGDPADYELDSAIVRLVDGFGWRDSVILFRRIYRPPRSRQTLDELGAYLHVTRERVRQIERQIEERVAAMLRQPPMGVVHREAARLRQTLGECIALADIPDRVRWALDETAAPDVNASVCGQVLLSLAGPYEEFDRWLVRGRATRLVEESREAVGRALDAGPAPAEEVVVHLAALGIPEGEQMTWLLDVCRCREFYGLIVPWQGSLADKAEQVLAIRGEPLAADEIVEALGPDTNRRSLLGQIQGNPRFRRRGLKLYGLSSWGGEEYTTIQDELAEEIERQGGAASLEHLITTLCSEFGVAEASVRAYANEAPFVQSDNGLVTVGDGPAQYAKVPIEDTRDCFRSGSHWALRVVVDSELLRGSGRPIPPGVLQHIGLKPGDRRSLVTPTGELLVRYGRQATIGSLRRAALNLDCEEGDLLFVDLTSDKTASFRRAARSDWQGESGISRLALEVGAPADDDPTAAVAHALGLPPDEHTAAAIRRRLRARREHDLLEYVPDDLPDAPPAYDDILGDLTS